MDNQRDLVDIVKELIKSNKEGVYWDFKSEPHNNNAKLLHDILCLANCSYPGDRYLVIGVSDHNEGCRKVGVTRGQCGRKIKADLLDFIKHLQFVGDTRPDVDLISIKISNKNIDVILMNDEPYKPFMLSQDYKDKGTIVRAGVVYTRTGDTNTSINETADFKSMDKMWKQRYGFDLAPIDRFLLLLSKPDEWVGYFQIMSEMYHKIFPEYNLKMVNKSNNTGYLSQFYSDEKTIYCELQMIYKNVVLDSFKCLYFEGEEVHCLFPVDSHYHRYPKVSFFYSLIKPGSREISNFLSQVNFMSIRDILYLTPIFEFDNIRQSIAFNNEVRRNIELILNYEFIEVNIEDDFELLESSHPKYEEQINMFKIKRFYDEWMEYKGI